MEHMYMLDTPHRKMNTGGCVPRQSFTLLKSCMYAMANTRNTLLIVLFPYACLLSILRVLDPT